MIKIIHKITGDCATKNTAKAKGAVYVYEVSCGQKRSFQSVPKGSQEVDLLNRRGAP